MEKVKDILIIPRYLAILRFIELPSIDSSEISNMAEFKALKELPYPRDEIITGLRNLGSYKSGFSYIMLAIVKKQLVEDMMKARKARPENIRLGTEILYLYMLKKGIIKQDKTNLIIDIQRDYSEIMVIDKTKPVFSRGFRNAENFPEEINKSIISYKRDRDNREIEEITVAHGSNLSIENSKPHIEALFSVPINFYEYKEDLNSPGFSLEIDLLPGEYIDKKLKKENTRQAFLTYSLLFIALAMLASFFVFKLYQKDKTILMLTEKTNRMQKDTDELGVFLKKTDILKSQKEEVGLVINILKEAYELAPGDMSVSGLDYDGRDTLYCKGAARNMSGVFDFIKILEKSKYFKKAEVKYATKKEAGNQEFTDFNIACQVK
ncbi:MAG: PilN domain-containing protein [Candidatus Omnitrophota bacterium]